MTPSEWMRELGAVRPMAPASECVFVLGEWIDGYYPVQYRRTCEDRKWNGSKWIVIPATDRWELFGVPCRSLDRETVERIMSFVHVWQARGE